VRGKRRPEKGDRSRERKGFNPFGAGRMGVRLIPPSPQLHWGLFKYTPFGRGVRRESRGRKALKR